jgi:hypothetical protein
MRKHTPVCDDPEAHQKLEKTISIMQKLNVEVNSATGNEQLRGLIEKTWLIQSRLNFISRTSKAPTMLHSSVVLHYRLSRIPHLLGHVILCGVLHIAYQGHDRVKGAYMICILYRSCLLLATSSKAATMQDGHISQNLAQAYDVISILYLANASVEEPNNGRGYLNIPSGLWQPR